MYTLAVVALLGLGLFKVIDILEDLVPALVRIHALVTVVLGVVAAVALDYSLFPGFKTVFRDAWMSTWATGFVLAGVTSVWHALFHWLGASEGEAPEVRHTRGNRPRIAA
jgi:hypothetical protein